MGDHTGKGQEIVIVVAVTGPCAVAVVVGTGTGTMVVQDVVVHEAAAAIVSARGGHLLTGPCPEADLPQVARHPCAGEEQALEGQDRDRVQNREVTLKKSYMKTMYEVLFLCINFPWVPTTCTLSYFHSPSSHSHTPKKKKACTNTPCVLIFLLVFLFT